MTVLNPSLTDPLGGLTFDNYSRVRATSPAGQRLRDAGADQVSIGMAQQLGRRYAFQADFVHTRRPQHPDDAQHQLLRGSGHAPAAQSGAFGRPYPAVHPHHALRDDRQDRSTTGCSSGSPARRAPRAVRRQQLHPVARRKGHTDANRFGAVDNPFDLADEYSYTTPTSGIAPH